jgi:hypothetical protein
MSPRLMANFDTRHTFISGRPATTWGVKVGLKHGKRIQYGIGVHWLRHGFEKQIELEEQPAELRLAYVAPFFEYNFIYRNNWEVAIPLRIGIGRSKLIHLPFEGDPTDGDHGMIMLYEPAMSAKYKFLNYFGVGAAVGYRLMLVNNRKIDQQFTAPTWGLLFSVDLGSMYADLSHP